ncbi:MAG TPA: methyltransferase domain-containing protein [Pirellulaceae bacterium]|jgi:ubiquinone/menaquinone biosynthesis C-methylase UbiE|nr:methyltransferase domain-containing protein [Pirellulaceae bacterium]
MTFIDLLRPARYAGSIIAFACLTAALVVVPPATAQESDEAPPALSEYMGRQIAQTMHWQGAEWLIRDSREREERCSLLLTNLGLKPGMTVCDMGCGNGYYALKIAKLIGERGKVYAVDVQPEMLEFLLKRAKEENVDNIVTVQGKFHDPQLPPDSQDLILVVDVYHEFSHPEQMLAGMRNALKADGLIALAEYRAEDPEVPIKPLHKMTKKQIVKEYQANGLYLVKEFDRLPWQHLMFFSKDASKQIEPNLDWAKQKGPAPKKNRSAQEEPGQEASAQPEPSRKGTP